MDHVVREMPPVDDRETRPSDSVPLPLGGPCYDDRLVVPPQMDHHEMVPTPVPLPEPEVIPTPDAATVLPGTHSVLVRAPAPAPSNPLPSKPSQAEAIWQPLDPGAPFAEVDAADVPWFLVSIEQRRPPARIPGESTPLSGGRARHAETRLALSPTAPSKAIPLAAARSAIGSPVPPRPAPTPPAPRPPVTVPSAPVVVPSSPVTRPVQPASPMPATGQTESDRLRWLALASLTMALAIAIFSWQPRYDALVRWMPRIRID